MFKLTDLYYALFRHKWKIFSLWTLGLAAAAAAYLAWPTAYVSEAKLLVRYVRDTRVADVVSGNSQIKSPDSGGQSIIMSEIEILTSFDLATNVAALVGPGRILGTTNEAEIDLNQAGLVVQKGLLIPLRGRSSTIEVSFHHRNPDIVQEVLNQLIESYLRKHMEVHRGVGMLDDFLSRETEVYRSRLSQTEEDMRQVERTAGVGSLADSRETQQLLSAQIAEITRQVIDGEALLAQQRALLTDLTKRAAPVPAPEALTNANAGVETNAPPAQMAVDPALTAKYLVVIESLRSAMAREVALANKFTDENRWLQDARSRVAELQEEKRQIELKEPRLVQQDRLEPNGTLAGPSPSGGSATYDTNTIGAQVVGLEARLAALREELAKARTNLAAVKLAEPRLRVLERERMIRETNFFAYSASQEQNRIDKALGMEKVPNISVVQGATPPSTEITKRMKVAGGILFAAFGGAIALALLLTLYVDQSIRRPADVERKLRAPLFAAIPDFFNNGEGKELKFLAERVDATGHDGNGSVPVAPDPKLPSHGPRLYWEAIRDRLILHFEIRNVSHKPKLVAVTSCTRGAGVSTIATGLARSLSETGDGKVLLIDMNQIAGPQVHPFYSGKAQATIADAFEDDRRDHAQVQDNLYVVSIRDANGGRVGVVPRHLAAMMPRMKASDYDYIIFDMPPVSQTSPTSKVAGLMDMVFMVVESERTNAELVRQANALLAESRSNVSVLLNKYRPYLPKRLRTDL